MKSYTDVVSEEASVVAEQVGEQAARVAARLAAVDHVVAVMSGKGGVGKSTIAVNLARVLAAKGHEIGLLDADINGPSAAKMTGVRGEGLRMGDTGMLPAESADGVKVMSVDLFLSNDDTPVIWEAPTQKDGYTWRGTMEAVAVREFLSDTEWGSLDVLLVDLPPGSDKLPTLADIVPGIAGVVIVTIPSTVSQHVVSKSIQLTREQLKTPVIGLVENMTTYVCPHCGEEEPLFGAGSEDRLSTYEIPLLGQIPFDPEFGAANDDGRVDSNTFSSRPAGKAIAAAAARVVQAIDL